MADTATVYICLHSQCMKCYIELMSEQHHHMLNYITDPPWRKKEIIVLTAERSGKSERTARNQLEYLEQRGFIKTIKISKNRVFIERCKENKLPLNFEIENQLQVQSLLEEICKIMNAIAENISSSRVNRDVAADSALTNLIQWVAGVFQNNTISQKKLEKINNNLEELNKLCRTQFVVVSEEAYIDCIFDILDNIIILLNTDINAECAEDYSESPSEIIDIYNVSKKYLSFLNTISVNAEFVGYEKAYNSRVCERIHLLRPLIEAAPPVADEVYYFIQPHANISQRMDTFISRIQATDGANIDQLLTDVQLFYNDSEKQKLRAQLEDTADELGGQQRKAVERLQIYIENNGTHSYEKTKLRYYNETKKKILAILSHGQQKLEDITMYAKEEKSNIHSNISKLEEYGHVKSIEHRRGYYKLDPETKKIFDKKRKQRRNADKNEVKEVLQQMKKSQEQYASSEGIQTYDNEQLIKEAQRPLWFKFSELVSDYSFILKEKSEIDMFFTILDICIEEMQKADAHQPLIPDWIIQFFSIAKRLHRRWRWGLENVRYHSELFEYINDLKKAHDCTPPNERKHIRMLISVVDIDEAEALFKQAVKDNIENTSDLKESIDTIYYKNNMMHDVIDFLVSNNENSSAQNGEVYEELIEYSLNLPHEGLSSELTK